MEFATICCRDRPPIRAAGDRSRGGDARGDDGSPGSPRCVTFLGCHQPADVLCTIGAEEADGMNERYVQADPYPWPYNGDLRPDNTALIIIDMQTDFCGIGGYVDRMGYDLSLTRAPIEPIQRLLAVA